MTSNDQMSSKQTNSRKIPNEKYGTSLVIAEAMRKAATIDAKRSLKHAFKSSAMSANTS